MKFSDARATHGHSLLVKIGKQRFVHVLGSVALAGALANCTVAEADAPAAADAVTAGSADLGQGWTAEDLENYERTPDGSALFSVAWMVALQLPTGEAFLSDANIRRLGFIPSPKSESNPLGMPVGFMAQTNKAMLGTNCAACHEAEITYRGKTMRIHGGQGSGNLVDFFGGAYRALGETAADPTKFDRFLDAVLVMAKVPKEPAEAYAAAKLDMKTKVGGALARVKLDAELQQEKGISHRGAGPYRTDALQSGANRLTAKVGTENLRTTNAPVSIPHLWSTPRFDWVEYNGSFRQPMGRNVGSALARGGDFKLSKEDPASNFENVVEMHNLANMEELVDKLQAPKWPTDILGPIDATRAKSGKKIYEATCASCHDSQRDPTTGLLAIQNFPLDVIGTDPGQATAFADRTVAMNGFLGIDKEIPYTEFTKIVLDGIADRNYKALGVSGKERERLDGYRPNDVRAPLAYRARPLDGIWATAPFLHNGSIPNLAQLLLPAAERVTKFKVGSAEMDPVNVGLVTTDGTFELDTTLPGNSNAGHTGPKFGTNLKASQRADLLEYLKTL